MAFSMTVFQEENEIGVMMTDRYFELKAFSFNGGQLHFTYGS